jgi:ABC-type branched-subunit amino acid transport system ATPase component
VDKDMNVSTKKKVDVQGDKLPALLKIFHVSKSFGGVQALDAVSFQIEKGIIKALIGPNGAGKSTLLNIISRLIDPEKGNIEFLMNDLLTYGPHSVAGMGIGRTFQMVQFSGSMSALKTVMVGAHSVTKKGMLAASFKMSSERKEEHEIRKRAFDALEFVGLASVADQPTNSLTYAAQKRLELARALIAKPRLLLLDEPAAGLTKQETEELASLLNRIKNNGITVLLIEHNMVLVRTIADQIIVLNYGKKIAEGAASEIFVNPEVIEAYLGKET